MLPDKTYMDTIVTAVATKFSLRDWSYEEGILEETMNNCFGQLLNINLYGFENSEKITKNLIIKIAPQNSFQEATKRVYATEIGVYEKLIPAFTHLKFPGNMNDLFIDCYYTTDNKIIVLKDVRYDGFKMSKENLDLNHIKVALKALAQFHGLSMLVLQRDKIECNGLFKPWDEKALFIDVLRVYFHEHIDLFKDTQHYQTIKTLLENFDDIVIKSLKKVKRLTYGHGDFWRENIMFKYEGQTPIKACLLDFQSTRLLCPAQDVLFFIITCLDSDLRQKHLMELLKTYYETLQETLAVNGVDDNFYTEEDFRSDIGEVAQFALIHAIFALSWWSGVDDSQKGKILTEDKIVRTTKEQQRISTENFKVTVTKIVQELKDLRILNDF